MLCNIISTAPFCDVLFASSLLVEVYTLLQGAFVQAHYVLLKGVHKQRQLC